MAARPAAKLALGGLSAVTAYRYASVRLREGQLSAHRLDVFSTSDASKKSKSDDHQRVLVVGGGVVGVATAYKLAKAGHSVTVLDAHPDRPGTECTAAAAGGMQRSNVVTDRDSWMAVAANLAPPLVAKWIFGVKEEEPFKFFHISWFRSLSDPFFYRWLLTFTSTSLFPAESQKDKQQEMLKFTRFAVDDMVGLLEKDRTMAKLSGYNTRGSLSVSYDVPVQDDDAAPASPSNMHTKMSYEPRRSVSYSELVQLEPSVKLFAPAPASAKYEWEAKSASAERFTKELARRCSQDLGVSFLYGTTVKAITCEQQPSGKPRIAELKTNRGVITVPDDVKVVVAGGAWTSHVLVLMDLYAPVYPLTGYAISVSAKEALKANSQLKNQDLPSRIVADKFMFTTRLGDEIRITSIGQFGGWDTTPTPEVDAEFRREAYKRMPQLRELIAAAPTHCGHRPFVSDGLVLLGAVDTHENLFVSAGPGSNGWKLAMGSGEVVARLVSGQSAEKMSKDLGFNVDAVSPAGRVKKAPVFAKLCRARWDV